MSAKISFDDALDAAIDAMGRGEHADEVIARYPTHADALRPLVELAAASHHHAARAHVPVSPRLAANFSSVAAAIRRAGLTVVPDSGQSTSGGHWWQRKLTFASLSLPAGAFALFALAGISGAAAASVAVTGDAAITERAADAARAVTPDWVPVAGHSSGPHGSDPSGASGGSDGNGSNASPGENEPAGGSSSGGGGAPGSTNAPQDVTASGGIAEVHGNVFTLTTGDGDLKVNVDGSTHVNGTIVDGATATVVGELTAAKNLHASSVDVTSLPATPNEAPDAGESPSSQDRHTPGPAPDHTPGPPPDHAPGPPTDHTTGPPADHPPPGESTAAPPGNSNADGNGNGGGMKKP